MLGCSIDELESCCTAWAETLDGYQPRKPSLLRIQQLLFKIASLSNAGDPKESYKALSEAVDEAKAIDLLLEEKWTDFSENDKEIRRRTFWFLYTWDR